MKPTNDELRVLVNEWKRRARKMLETADIEKKRGEEHGARQLTHAAMCYVNAANELEAVVGVKFVPNFDSSGNIQSVSIVSR